VSFPGTPLPRALLTGNPVRGAVVDIAHDAGARAKARAALGISEGARLVAAFGGSLGARRINEAVVELAAMWASRGDIALRHIVGDRDWDSISSRRPDPVAGGLLYQLVAYEDHMEHVYAAADVAVCRAGASTVAELMVAGLPAVLVPLPGAPGDHQTANARAMVSAGAAVVVPDGEATAARLAAELDELLADRSKLAAMSEAARRAARPDAARTVAALVEAHAAGPPGAREATSD
jgi:UDP-N-acetylglucosamine--N-acetylmuramyl-(pentapeptide) pyrophosphoryl-undecaprenol N-acetylglucosamine transferase